MDVRYELFLTYDAYKSSGWLLVFHFNTEGGHISTDIFSDIRSETVCVGGGWW